MRKLWPGFVLVSFVALALVVPASAAIAQWIENGTPVCTATGNQVGPSVASDGAGGGIVCWSDPRSGSYDIYAQRVNAFGAPQWTADGVAICTAADRQDSPVIIPDGAGGAIITWFDSRGTDTDIYAQRIDATGTVQWATNGIALCIATGNQDYPEIVTDGSGGAIVAWRDSRGSDIDIYAQLVNASGTVQWATNGVPLCTAAGDQEDQTAISDGAGGAIVTWEDPRGIDLDIYAQKVSAAGAVQWSPDGEPVCSATGEQRNPEIATDGVAGAVVVWEDRRSGNTDIYVQSLTASGSAKWTTDGVAACTVTGSQSFPTIVSNGAAGAIVTWHDSRVGDSDIYAQRFDYSGVALWTTDGVGLSLAPGDQSFPQIVSDGSGGAIVTWYDFRNGSDYDIYAQGVDVYGGPQWTTSGMPLCTLAGSQTAPGIVSDGSGGALIAWGDSRNGPANWDIHAQRMTREGHWGYPAPKITSVQDVTGDQGGSVRIRFANSRLDAWPDLGIYHYSVWRALSPSAALNAKSTCTGLNSPSRATPDLVGKAYYSSSDGDWELIGTVEPHLLSEYGFTASTLRDSTSVDDGWEYFFVSAHGSGNFYFWDSPPDSGYSVDNLAPSAPAALTAEYSGGSELHIHWNPNTEADLSHYAVYRGTAPDFAPDETNLIGTAMDSTFVDDDFGYEEYYYMVSAIDVHENESSFSLLTPDMITGVPGERPHLANVLFQNTPNPFLSSTRIAFSLKQAGHVRLGVFDAKGRLVRVLVDEVRQSNHYVESWDGRDGDGKTVPAGMYFYSLEAPSWRSSKKMILAR